jgi:hypothetical protein
LTLLRMQDIIPRSLYSHLWVCQNAGENAGSVVSASSDAVWKASATVIRML